MQKALLQTSPPLRLPAVGDENTFYGQNLEKEWKSEQESLVAVGRARWERRWPTGSALGQERLPWEAADSQRSLSGLQVSEGAGASLLLSAEGVDAI